MRKSKSAALYFHIPFCRRKCLYCDFCSYAGQGEDVMASYVERLCCEARERADALAGQTVDTVYFGGGTPTLLPPPAFSRLIDTVKACYTLSDCVEITSECNPATADAHKLAAMREAGINRLSIGAQSANDEELQALGRIHTHAQTVQTVKNARAAGFDNVSLDLMYGIPHQTRQSFAHTLEEALSLAPEHISAYSLILEEGTPFFERQDQLPLPDEDAVCDMTDAALAFLRAHGYERYEISNFAIKGYECRHHQVSEGCRSGGR